MLEVSCGPNESPLAENGYNEIKIPCQHAVIKAVVVEWREAAGVNISLNSRRLPSGKVS